MEHQKSKEQRKRDGELKREERNKKTTTKSSRKKQVRKTSSEEEEWVESGSSIDYIDDENQEQDEIQLFSVEDLNLGDYILASFQSVGRRAPSTYKYVSKILKILPKNEYEIPGLRSLDQSKIVFKYIGNDVSVITDGRILKIAFPTSVDVFEKVLSAVLVVETKPVWIILGYFDSHTLQVIGRAGSFSKNICMREV
ncbi:hypothetical protein JTB14_034281 [Gonioctena quinquepunctata]|nr:hypothetical protein JTB14_034281 [Gonioctena quinquepunctata]